ncbi:MAG: AMP-binding protein [Rhodospirillaceae bacterium]|jgi:long-chain acyl-CoA synthetase|nr:AMP-binding protein [Rhodospirillaceae bacterium]MBT5939971.1 AMP-binding protein [Rhodospirillaceae bacterium]MBT7267132.1 AMP-binding protein [Rhodospirillaceae bacterium]
MNIASLLAKSAITWAVRPALALGSDIVQSYSEHAEEAARLAGGLRHSLGLSPGERIGIAMKNSPAYSTTLFAAWHAGLAAVPMNAKLHAREFEFILKNAGITVCFVDDDLVTTLKDASQDIPDVTLINISSKTYTDLIAHDEIDMAETDPNDLAWLFYTSGTTGRPKGAMLSHRNLLMMTISYFGDVDPVSECDSLLHAAPMSHGSGLYILPYVAKGALQIIPRSGGFDPAEIAGLLSKYQNVNAFFAPTMVTRLINAPEITPGSTENLKTIVYGGGPMYVEDCLKALALIGPKLVQIYGQGEAPMTITALSRAQHTNSEDPRYLEKLASVGTARSDLEICIQGGDEQPLPAGEIGEVCVRGDVVMQGYWNNSKATQESLRGGWLHTGDIGELDQEGFLTLKDRSKDVIISGGSNIYPREVEEILLQHSGVLEASVIGRPHVEWGEEVVAFIVCQTDAKVTETELDQLCLNNIARFKRPKAYLFVAELPKNNYGKILKTTLREMLQSN